MVNPPGPRSVAEKDAVACDTETDKWTDRPTSPVKGVAEVPERPLAGTRQSREKRRSSTRVWMKRTFRIYETGDPFDQFNRSPGVPAFRSR
jgi:hypothetical protein